MQLFGRIVRAVSARLPDRRETLGVLGMVLFVVFGWSIRGFLYKIPSFTLYFGLGANLAILCYMFAFALLESLIVTLVLLLFSILLPSRLLKDGFAYKGFLIVLVATLAMIRFESFYKVDYFKDVMAHDYSSVPPFVLGALMTLLALAILLWVFHRRPRLQKLSIQILDQISLFTYIYVPLGLLGLLVVIIRNLR